MVHDSRQDGQSSPRRRRRVVGEAFRDDELRVRGGRVGHVHVEREELGRLARVRRGDGHEHLGVLGIVVVVDSQLGELDARVVDGCPSLEDVFWYFHPRVKMDLDDEGAGGGEGRTARLYLFYGVRMM